MGSKVAKLETPKVKLVEAFAGKYGVDADKLLTTLKLTAFKGDRPPSNEEMMSLIIVANEYNLNPFTKEIWAFPNKGSVIPVISLDGWVTLCNSHPSMNGMEFDYSDTSTKNDGAKNCPDWIECSIHRKDREIPVTIREYLDECYKPSGPWKSHTKRMLRHKALQQCARLAFGFSGIYDEDEAARIVEGEVIENTAPTMPKREDFLEEEVVEHESEDVSTDGVFNFILRDEFGTEIETFGTDDAFVDAAIDNLKNVATADGSVDAYMEWNEECLNALGPVRDSDNRQRFNVAMNERKADIKSELGGQDRG
tara:strand:+ start:131 stop:1060 length:930 start_codon:yes stop_codon:yes gene_type:complete